MYVAPGGGGGYPDFAPGASFTAGWLLKICTPKDNEISNFLTKKSFSAGGFWPVGPVGAGGYGTWSPGNGSAFNVGLGSPGISGGGSYGFQFR
jgi:hypothetical protein